MKNRLLQQVCPKRPVLLLSVLLLAVLIGLSGCSGKRGGTKNKVHGTVTINKKPVDGTLSLVGSDNKDFSTPINASDGSYLIEGLPAGTYTVVVKSMTSLSAGGPQGAGGDLPNMPKMAKGVPPPAKYAKPETSKLTYEVENGDHEKNFELDAK